jgi:hypothetical protein
VSILRTFIEKLETSGAVVPSAVDELEPLRPPLAAAEAAIEEAIRQRQAETADRRVSDAPVYIGPERRAGDRRKTGFGRRERD